MIDGYNLIDKEEAKSNQFFENEEGEKKNVCMCVLAAAIDKKTSRNVSTKFKRMVRTLEASNHLL